MSVLRGALILSVLLLGKLYLSSAHERTRPSHSCVHDELNIVPDEVEVSYEKDSNGRMLASYSNIRITFDTTNIDSLSDTATVAYIKKYLLPPAEAYFEKALKVVPLSSNLKFPSTSSVCSGTVPLPSKYQSTGDAIDLLILVTAYADTSSNYIAYASACAITTTTYRPVLGNLNYNLAYVSATTNNADIDADIAVTMHELTHALGFSSSLYSSYIDPSTNQKLSSPKTTKTVNGNSITVLTLSTLTTKVQNYFGCSTATGAYIENQGGTGSAGSHWERRVFYNEYMTASAIKDLRVSEFTLALLEGTGWYQVDYSMTDTMTYGKGKGCNFLDSKCVDTSTKLTNFDEFCTLGAKGCSWTGRAFSICNYGSGSSSAISSSMNYWGNYTETWDDFADNCPTYQTYSNKDCLDYSYQSSTTLPSQEYYGYGSRCFSGTLNVGTSYMSSLWGYCFKPTCYQDNSNYIVEVAIGSTKVNCTSKSQISVTGFGGYLQCPDPTDFCGRIMTEGNCPRGCFGQGTCVNNACQCNSGYSGNDCSRSESAISTYSSSSASSSSSSTSSNNSNDSSSSSSSSTTMIIAIVAAVGGVFIIGAVIIFIKRKGLLQKLRRGRAPRHQPQQQYTVSPPQTVNVPQTSIYNGNQWNSNPYQGSAKQGGYNGNHQWSYNTYQPQPGQSVNQQMHNYYDNNYQGYGNRV